MVAQLHDWYTYIQFSLHTTHPASEANGHCAKLLVEEKVAITLWRLGTYLEYGSISHLFGVGLPRVYITVREVCTSSVLVVMARYIEIPTGKAAQTVVDGFLHNWGFAQYF